MPRENAAEVAEGGAGPAGAAAAAGGASPAGAAAGAQADSWADQSAAPEEVAAETPEAQLARVTRELAEERALAVEVARVAALALRDATCAAAYRGLQQGKGHGLGQAARAARAASQGRGQGHGTGQGQGGGRGQGQGQQRRPQSPQRRRIGR